MDCGNIKFSPYQYYSHILAASFIKRCAQDERQGKMLLHTENSLLSLLEGESGVIQKHATFVDTAPQVSSQCSV